MTKLRHSMTTCCLLLEVLLLAGNSRAQTRPPIVEKLAAPGLECESLSFMGVGAQDRSSHL
jgi:hypothetical protein